MILLHTIWAGNVLFCELLWFGFVTTAAFDQEANCTNSNDCNHYGNGNVGSLRDSTTSVEMSLTDFNNLSIIILTTKVFATLKTEFDPQASNWVWIINCHLAVRKVIHS